MGQLMVMREEGREINVDVGEYREKLTKECFFLEDRSSVISYKLSTKFRRQGTFTSFFTVCNIRSNTICVKSVFFHISF